MLLLLGGDGGIIFLNLSIQIRNLLLGSGNLQVDLGFLIDQRADLLVVAVELILNLLLQQVLEKPQVNNKELLLQVAAQLKEKIGTDPEGGKESQ